MDKEQLDMVCGGCEFWRPSEVMEEQPPNGKRVLQAVNDAPPEPPKARPGHCWRFPPTGYLMTQRHPMTGEPLMGTVAVRPPVTDTDPACGEFESIAEPDLNG